MPSLILLFDGLKHAYEAQHENEDSDDESEDDDKVRNSITLRFFISSSLLKKFLLVNGFLVKLWLKF